MEAFKSSELVPDILDEVPLAQATVKYPDGPLSPGMTKTPTQVQSQPEVSWEAEQDALYTLFMDDPDAPSRADPKFGEFLHWMVTNIPGNDVSKGDFHMEYIGSGPPQGSGLHRYAFLVFKQKGKVDASDVQRSPKTSAEGRRGFKVRAFAKKHDLGAPVAGNFYLAEYDDYVPVVWKQMGLL